MEQREYSEETLKKYLMGELSGAELDQIERDYLADQEFFDQLLAAEDDLIDEYVNGEMNAQESERFENKLLVTPRQREKLRQAQILQSTPVQTPATATREVGVLSRATVWLDALSQRRIIAFATLLLLFTTGWLALRVWQMNSRLQQMEAERLRLTEERQQLQARLASQQEKYMRLSNEQQSVSEKVGPGEPQKTENGPRLATIVLPLISTRAGGATTFTLKRDLDLVQLQAQLGKGSYQSYQAELENADGKRLYRITSVTPRRMPNGDALVLRVPANIFQGRDYVLKISGVTVDGRLEDAGFYSFRITRN